MTTLGKATLIAIGAGFGLIRALRIPGVATVDNAQMQLVKARIDALDLAVARLGEQTAHMHAKIQRMVTHEDLQQSLDRVFGRLEGEIDSRVDRQMRSVEALRLMVGQTDELLQKVLDALETIHGDRDPA